MKTEASPLRLMDVLTRTIVPQHGETVSLHVPANRNRWERSTCIALVLHLAYTRRTLVDTDFTGAFSEKYSSVWTVVLDSHPEDWCAIRTTIVYRYLVTR